MLFFALSPLLYPFFAQDGQSTKPTSQLGAIPFWSGRALPDKGSWKLPAFVAAAQKMAEQQGVVSSAWHLVGHVGC